MDQAALDRVQERLSAASGAHAPASAAVRRNAIELGDAATPALIGEAVRKGLRTEVLPVARHIAELRGLFNQANRRLERIEADLLAERKARVEDLALLVDLVTAGWRGVDARLARLEQAQDDAPSGHAGTLVPEQLPEPGEIAERAAA